MNVKDLFAAFAEYSAAGNNQNAATQRRVMGRPVVARPAASGSGSGTRKGCVCPGTRKTR